MPNTLPPKDWIRREYDDIEYNERTQRLHSRERILRRFTLVFVGALLFTLLIVLLQGFHLWGFSLDTTTVNLLAGATIGEIVGLLVIAFRWLFDQRS